MLAELAIVPESDPAYLTHDERIGLLAEIEHARAALDALQVSTLAALWFADGSEKKWVRDEVACALQIAPITAAGKLHDARDLLQLLPLTYSFVCDATITLAHAAVLLDLARVLDDATRSAVESRVLRRAPGQTVSQFRQSVRRAVASLDPRREEDKHRDAMVERRVVLSPREDGMSELWALLPADAATRLMTVLNRFAADTVDGVRTADQRRADALGEVAELADTGGLSAIGDRSVAPTGPGPSIHVTVSLSTLLGCDDQPGELGGYGPIPASMARRLAEDPTGTWHRLVTDPAGRLLDASRSYRPPTRLREHVIARDRTCRFPGCRRQARTCEVDHRRAYEHGGPTTEDNLHALCSRHHHLKHEAPGWSVTKAPGGDTEWQTPSGRTHIAPPEPYPPDPTPEFCAS